MLCTKAALQRSPNNLLVQKYKYGMNAELFPTLCFNNALDLLESHDPFRS